MKNNHKKGFTLIELVVVITIIGLIGTSLTGLLVFGLDIFGLANRDFQMQTDVRMALEDTSKLVRFAKAMFAVPDVDYLDDEWNYIGLNDDNTAIINYKWDPVSETHIRTPMVGPYDDVTFNIGFYKEDNMQKDNTIQIYFEMLHQDGTVKRFNIQTGYEALNSLQVVDYGTTSNPAKALAYRSDDFHYENYLLKVNITLILDVSGSMNSTLNGKTTNIFANKRATIMKEKTRGLIESFAANTNDDVEINIALVPFSTSANGVKVFRNVKTQKTTLLADVNSLCGGNTNNTQNCLGGTNTGDGMRRAYYRLLEKSQAQANDTSITREYKIKNYNIFLTDGDSTYHSIDRYQSGTRKQLDCVDWKKNGDCKKKQWVTYPAYAWKYFLGDGNITESKASPSLTAPAGQYIAGAGDSTSAEDNTYVTNVGAMLAGVLPVTGYDEDEDVTVTNYIIGFTAGVSQTSIYHIATATNTPKVPPNSRVFFASTGDDLALSFSEISTSITNDTWHYLGPKLVE